MLTFECSLCCSRYEVADDLAEKVIRCRECNEMNRVSPPKNESRPPAQISFSCRNCSKSFRVASDKVGKKTKCPACGELLEVPTVGGLSAPASRSLATEKPSSTRSGRKHSRNRDVAILAVIVSALVIIGGTILWFNWPKTPKNFPEKATVHVNLLRTLPPGSKKFEITYYAGNNKEGSDRGYLRFEVIYPDYGDPVGITYRVSRRPISIPANPPEDTVTIDTIRMDMKTMKEIRLADYTFVNGEMKNKNIGAASAREGPIIESMAVQLERAVREAY